MHQSMILIMTNNLEMERHSKKHNVSRKVMALLMTASLLAVGCLVFANDCDNSYADGPKGYAVDGLDYVLRSNFAYVVGYVGSSPVNLEIPGGVIINGTAYSVKGIDAEAFKDCKTLKSITMEGNVAIIGAQAFFGCTSLETVDMGDDVVSIGYQAFYACTELKEVKMSKKLDNIAESAFEACFSLPSIIIPKNVTMIEPFAFSRCRSMSSITVMDGNPCYVSDNGVVYNKKDKTTLHICPSGIGTFTVPKDVTTIDISAFSGDAPMKIEFVSGCETVLKRSSFHACESLTIVVNDGANLTFEENAIFMFKAGEYVVNVKAPEGYEIPATAYNSNIKIEYSGLNGGSKSPILLIVIGVVGALVVVGAVAFFIMKKRV